MLTGMCRGGPKQWGYFDEHRDLLATMPNRNVLSLCIKQEMGSLTIFHITVYNLKGDGMFNGGVSGYSK